VSVPNPLESLSEHIDRVKITAEQHAGRHPAFRTASRISAASGSWYVTQAAGRPEIGWLGCCVIHAPSSPVNCCPLTPLSAV
jgi:hypothetical protein